MRVRLPVTGPAMAARNDERESRRTPLSTTCHKANFFFAAGKQILSCTQQNTVHPVSHTHTALPLLYTPLWLREREREREREEA